MNPGDVRSPVPRFLRGLLIAATLGFAALGILSYFRGGDGAAPQSLPEVASATRKALADEELIPAGQYIDKAIDIGLERLEAKKPDPALEAFRLARDLSVEAQGVAETVLEKRRAPGEKKDAAAERIPPERASEDPFGVRGREATARYYIAVCLYRRMEARYADAMAAAEKAGERFTPSVAEVEAIRREIQAGLKANDEEKRLWRLQGILDNMMGRFPAAARSLEQAIEIDPRYGPAYNNLGRVYLNMRQYDKALSSFEKALLVAEKEASVRAGAHYNLGVYHGRVAQEALQEARRQPTAESRARAQHEVEKARRHLRMFMETAPADDAGREQAGELLERLSTN